MRHTLAAGNATPSTKQFIKLLCLIMLDAITSKASTGKIGETGETLDSLLQTFRH